MKRCSPMMIGLIAVFFLMLTVSPAPAKAAPGEMLEYEVISINPGNWVVTAKEVANGNVVKFKLPPNVFKGKSFDANLRALRKGQRFSVRGPRNARLSQLIMQSPGRAARARKQQKRLRRPGLLGPPARRMNWIIQNVDPRTWVVTARHSKTGKIAKFKTHPEAFKGFRFKADLNTIKQGQGFSIVTPNNSPINNVATLMELQK